MASTTKPARTRYSACGRSASLTMMTLCPMTTPGTGVPSVAPSGRYRSPAHCNPPLGKVTCSMFIRLLLSLAKSWSVAMSCGGGLGARASRGCGRESHEVGDADGPQYLPFAGADAAPGLVVVQARRHEPDGASPGLQLAAAGRHDVLDPVRVGTVGQGDQVAVRGREHVHRRPVAAAQSPAAVHDDTEARQPRRDVPGEAVQANLVPLPYSAGNRHVCSFTGGPA